MKDLKKYVLSCKHKLDTIGIQYGNIIDVAVNQRAKKRWGQCIKRDSGFAININVKLLDDSTPDKALEETILHEMLHTCDGCMNHGKQWSHYAHLINRKYDYNVKRASSCDDKGVEPTPVYSTMRYEFVCTKCGAKVHRERMSKFVKSYFLYRCGRCGGDFAIATK